MGDVLSSDIQSEKICDIFLEMNPRGNLGLWLFSLFYVMKQRLGSDKRWMRQRPLCLNVHKLHILLSYNLMLI